MLRDLLFTPRCIGCSTLGIHLCARCLAELKPHEFRIGVANIQCCSAGRYDGWLRDAVIAYKSGRRTAVHSLTMAAIPHIPRGVTLVPVPSSQVKIRERGYDTMGLLSRHIAKHRQDVRFEPALRLVRPVVDQVGLNARERRRNVADAFQSIKPLTGHILLLDDVVTTGATLSECVRAVESAGAKHVFGFSLCASANKSYL